MQYHAHIRSLINLKSSWLYSDVDVIIYKAHRLSGQYDDLGAILGRLMNSRLPRSAQFRWRQRLKSFINICSQSVQTTVNFSPAGCRLRFTNPVLTSKACGSAGGDKVGIPQTPRCQFRGLSKVLHDAMLVNRQARSIGGFGKSHQKNTMSKQIKKKIGHLSEIVFANVAQTNAGDDNCCFY